MAMYRNMHGLPFRFMRQCWFLPMKEKKIDNISSNFFCLLYDDLVFICTVSEKSPIINRDSLNVPIPSWVAG